MNIYEYIIYIVTAMAPQMATALHHSQISSVDILMAFLQDCRRKNHPKGEVIDSYLREQNTRTYNTINRTLCEEWGYDLAHTYDQLIRDSGSSTSEGKLPSVTFFDADGVKALFEIEYACTANAEMLDIRVPLLTLLCQAALQSHKVAFDLGPRDDDESPSMEAILLNAGLPACEEATDFSGESLPSKLSLAEAENELKGAGKFIQSEQNDSLLEHSSEDVLDAMNEKSGQPKSRFESDHWLAILRDIKQLEENFGHDGGDSSRHYEPGPVHFIKDLNIQSKGETGSYSLDEKALRSLEISMNSGRSLLLVGKNGIGRKSLVKELVHRMNAGTNLSSFFTDHHIYEIDANQLAGGTIWRGQFEGRVAKLVEFVEKPSHEGMVLYFPDASITIGLGAGSDNPMGGLSNGLTPALAERKITMLGCIDSVSYSRLLKQNSHFFNLFNLLNLQEPEGENLRAILKETMGKKMVETELKVAPDFLEDVIAMGKLLENGEANPAKGIKLIERAFDYALLMGFSKVDRQVLEAEVAEQYSLQLSSDAALRTRNALRKALKGQDEAIEEVYQALVGVEEGVSSPEKPLLSLAFFGPSGVGKTATAKIIAKEFCGSEKALIKIDAGQFNTPGDYDRLFDGDGGGILINALQQNPRCCILIDELEKAPARFSYNLMALLDEGIVRDSSGRPQSAKGAIVILTSNVGAELEVGQYQRNGYTEKPIGKKDVISLIAGSFKSEFLGRIDRLVIYQHLSPKVYEEITLADVQAVKARSKEAIQNLLWTKEDTRSVLAHSDVLHQGARSIEKNVEAQLLEKLFSSKKEAPVS